MPETNPFNYPSNEDLAIRAQENDYFKGLQSAKPDPLFGLKDLIKDTREKDPNAEIMDLTLGVYRDNEGRCLTIPPVAEAKNEIGAAVTPASNPEYLGQKGAPEFIEKTLEVIFGKNNPLLKEHRDRIAALGTPGGTGALYLSAVLLKSLEKESGKKVKLFYGHPTWPNHLDIFGVKQDLDMIKFSHLDKDNNPDLNSLANALDGILGTEKINEKFIPTVLLHGVCHNSTGLDYSEGQIREIAEMLKKHKAHAIIDLAYQGLGNGYEEDSFMVRHFASEGIPTMITYSYSKNQSMYQDRVGLFASVNQNADIAKIVQGRAENIARTTWSNPPAHGEKVIIKTLSPEKIEQVIEQNNIMREDINGARAEMGKMIGNDCPTIERGRGLFNITGLNSEQVSKLAEPHHDEVLGKNVYIFMPKSGRINIGAFAKHQIPIFCERVRAVLKSA